MFNLFQKKKPFDEIVKAANLTQPWEWTPTQTPSMLQAQNELIEKFLKENHDLKLENQELTKEVLQLRHLKKENVDVIDEIKKQNYPHHWGGYTNETPWETAAADLALRVVKLEKKVEELTLIKVTSDPNYRYFLKNGVWPWDNKKTK